MSHILDRTILGALQASALLDFLMSGKIDNFRHEVVPT